MESLMRLPTDWLRVPSPKLPFPTSLDEIRPSKQQSTILYQPPVTYSLCPAYAEDVFPVKVTPAIQSQLNQSQPFSST
ncbi:hypothetical protein FRC03_006968 [Tulasnella sp. 419]|nr:hypothetical protein FRC03_006968 [Tulasnella sp. 419]